MWIAITTSLVWIAAIILIVRFVSFVDDNWIEEECETWK